MAFHVLHLALENSIVEGVSRYLQLLYLTCGKNYLHYRRKKQLYTSTSEPFRFGGGGGGLFGGKVNYLGNHRFFQNTSVLRSQVHVSLELASLYKPPQTASFQQHRFNRVTGNA